MIRGKSAELGISGTGEVYKEDLRGYLGGYSGKRNVYWQKMGKVPSLLVGEFRFKFYLLCSRSFCFLRRCCM